MESNKVTKKALHHAITKELGDFIESKSSTFACGGSVTSKSGDGDAAGTSESNPIVLRWDSAGSSPGVSKLIFPADAASEESKSALDNLIVACQPASFGYKGEDVLDESYRKAAKMDRSAFCVDFCPYELGIIDTIAQILLPNAGSNTSSKGVKAELYKLNIYSAPSGFFKAHVDTPRSDNQFGSLVVSLPYHHVGGQLIVRHAGQSVTFDWGASSASENVNTSLQWAAFYCDCEHEVLEVTEGHRITLTYNLYHAPGVGELAGNSPVMDVSSLPLYKKVKEALAEPNFMAAGGYLGVFCQHAYAHSTPEGIKSLPGILKGADMAVYSVFLALGLDVAIRPVVNFDEELFDDDGGNHVGQDYLAHELESIVVSEMGGDELDSMSDIIDCFDGEWMKVNWLNMPMHGNVGFVHLTYGNQAGINYMYTSAALVVSVPPARQRGKKGGKKRAFDTAAFD